MPIKAGERHHEGGFTLIEVLVAMLILAVGLLGLEALGIGAARSVSMAQRQSQYAKIASDSLESALHQLRRQTMPSNFCIDLPRGDRLSRRVLMAGANVANVSVTALPGNSPGSPGNPFEVRSSLYVPTLPAGNVNGAPCS